MKLIFLPSVCAVRSAIAVDPCQLPGSSGRKAIATIADMANSATTSFQYICSNGTTFSFSYARPRQPVTFTLQKESEWLCTCV